MKKILITGAAGQLGNILIKKLNKNNIVFGTDHKCMDFCNKNKVIDIFKRIKPDIVIHCGAYTAVDKAETDKYNSYKVNVTGTENLVNCALEYNSDLLYVSTDYIFNGKKGSPYYEYDEVDPLNWYGYTKLAGEKVVSDHLNRFYIVRTSWVYGYGENNFVEKIIKRAKEIGKVEVVNDQIGSPTFVDELAEQIKVILNNKSYGIYHASGEGECSWFDFAKEIIKLTELDVQVKPVLTSKFNLVAKRPEYSVLENMSLKQKDILIMKHWKDALTNYFKSR